MLLLASLLPAWAGTATWTGTTDGNWGTAANWGGTLPTFDNTLDVTLTGSTNINPTFLGVNRTLQSLNFPAGSTTAISLRLSSAATGGTSDYLVFDSASGNPSLNVDPGAASHTIGAGYGFVKLLKNLLVTNNSANPLVVTRPIYGTNSLTKEGAGELRLGSAGTATYPSSFSGGINLNGGILACFGSPSVLGTGPLTLAGGTTLKAANGTSVTYTNSIVVNGDFTLLGYPGYPGVMNLNGPLNLGATTRTITVVNDGVISGVISGSGGLAKAGADPLTLSGTNTYSGPTFINAGVLALSGGALITNTPSIVVAGNAIFDVSGLSNAFTLASALSSQTLSNSASPAMLSGDLNAAAGALALTYASGTPSFFVSGGTLTLSSNTLFRINNTGTTLTAGSHKLIATTGLGTGQVAGSVPASVVVSGAGAAAPASLQIIGGELYLNVGVTQFTLAVTPDANPVLRYSRLQLSVDYPNTVTNPFNPEEVDLQAQFTSPSGTHTTVNGFWDGSTWRIRFAAAEVGQYRYDVTLSNNPNFFQATGVCQVVSSTNPGWIKVSPRDAHYFEQADGTPFYGVGFCKPWNLQPDLFTTMNSNGCNIFVYWLAAWDNTLLDMTNGYDHYNLAHANNVDQIIQACESNQVKMIFTVWDHGFLKAIPSYTWETNWYENPFNQLTTCANFFTDTNSWNYQSRFYRYVIARWGYSTSVGLWHTISEINGTDAGSNADSWHQKINQYFSQNDPFRHPTTASRSDPTIWNGLTVTDSPQVHNYGGNQTPTGIAGNVAAVTSNLFTLYVKPNFHGECGLQTNSGEFARTTFQHNAAWAALATGAAINPLMWNDGVLWGNQSPAMYQQLANFRHFVDSVDMPGQSLTQGMVTTTLSGGLVRALQGTPTSLLWLQATTGSGNTITNATVTWSGLTNGTYQVTGYNTWAGSWYASFSANSTNQILTLTLPAFTNDIALQLLAAPGNRPAPATNLTIVVSGPNRFSVSGQGGANQPYGLYTSTNLAVPMTNWWRLGTTNSDAGGLIRFLDTQATNQQQFYRFGQ